MASSPSQFADAPAVLASTADNAAGSAVIHLGSQDTITLNGLHAASLKTASFLLG